MFIVKNRKTYSIHSNNYQNYIFILTKKIYIFYIFRLFIYFQISFTYRLAWNIGKWRICLNQQQKLTDCWKLYLRPGFPPATHQPHNRWQNYRWMCTSGCNKTTTMSTLTNLEFTDINEFLDDRWETGVGIFNVTFADEDMTDIVFG